MIMLGLVASGMVPLARQFVMGEGTGLRGRVGTVTSKDARITSVVHGAHKRRPNNDVSYI